MPVLPSYLDSKCCKINQSVREVLIHHLFLNKSSVKAPFCSTLSFFNNQPHIQKVALLSREIATETKFQNVVWLNREQTRSSDVGLIVILPVYKNYISSICKFFSSDNTKFTQRNLVYQKLDSMPHVLCNPTITDMDCESFLKTQKYYMQAINFQIKEAAVFAEICFFYPSAEQYTTFQ